MKNWFKSKTFAGRLARRIILVMLLTMTFTSGLIFIWATVSMSLMTSEHYMDVLRLTNEKVNKMLTAVEISAANNQVEIENNLSSPDKVMEALKSELSFNKHYIGIGVAFTPEYYSKQGHWFEPYVVRRGNQIEMSQIGSHQHDYFKSDWYNTSLTKDSGYWSNPYFDPDGAKMMLCTYSLPIYNEQGQIAGVMGLDMPLGWLYELLQQIYAEEKKKFLVVDSTDSRYAPYSFILSRDGTYMVHPDSSRILKKKFLEYAKLSPDTVDDKLCHDMMAGKTGYEILQIDDIRSFVFYAPLECAEWSMAIVVPLFTIFYIGVQVAIITLILLLLGLLLVFRILRISIRRTTKPLKMLSESAKEVAKGNFDTPLPDIKFDDEIKVLRNSFETMQISLSQYVEQLKITTAKQAAMESELSIAHSIQMSMLPKTFPPFPERTDVDVFGCLKPAKAVGGDLFDFFIRNDQLYFCIGDVSGKGVPASLVMTVIRSLFRNISAHESEPARIVSTLNDSLVEGNETQMFATLFVGVLRLNDGLMSYCNAGHEAPILLSNEVSTLPCEPNLPVGVMSDFVFGQQQTTLAPNTIVFLYTDGLNEAENVKNEQFGDQRIIDVANAVMQNGHSQATEIVEEMDAAVASFVNGAEQSDDLTMLALHYLGKNNR